MFNEMDYFFWSLLIASCGLLVTVLFSLRVEGGFIFSINFWYVLAYLMYVFFQILVIWFFDGAMYIERYYVNYYRQNLFYGSILIFIATVFFFAGCSIGNGTVYRGGLNNILFFIDSLSFESVKFACVLASVISLVVTFVYFNFVGVDIFSGSDLFSKRIIRTDAGEFLAYGYLRQLSSIGSYSFIIYFAWMLKKFKTKLNYNISDLVALFFTLLSAIVFPVFTSSRGLIIGIIISAAIIYNFIYGRISLKNMIAIAIIGTLVLVILRDLRVGSVGDLVYSGSGLNSFFDPFLYGGGMSIFNTGTIALYFSDIDYLMGYTYLGLLTAPIPRSMWTSKPQVSPDQYVAENIYGYFGDGWYLVPPGYFGELYMNFGVIGIIFGAFLLGAILAYLCNVVLKDHKYGSPAKIVFFVFLTRILSKILGSSVGAAMIDYLAATLFVCSIYYIAWIKNAKNI